MNDITKTTLGVEETEEDRARLVNAHIEQILKSVPKCSRESNRKRLLTKYKIFIKYGNTKQEL